MSGLLNTIVTAGIGALVAFVSLAIAGRRESKRNQQDGLQGFNETLVDDNSSLRDELNAVRGELKDLQRQMADCLAQVAIFQAKTITQAGEIETLNAKLSLVEGEREHYQQEMLISRLENHRLEEQLQSQRSAMFDLQTTIRKVFMQLQDAVASRQTVTEDMLGRMIATLSAADAPPSLSSPPSAPIPAPVSSAAGKRVRRANASQPRPHS